MIFQSPYLSRNHLLYNLQSLFFILVIFTLPFKYIYNSIAVIAFVASWLLQGDFKNKFSKIISDKMVLLFSLFYFLALATLIYSDDLKEGIYDAKLKISLFVFPLALSSSPQFYKKENISVLLKIFIVSVCTACVVCHFTAFYELLMSKKPWTEFFSKDFSYSNLTSYLKIHPVYLAMYACFTAVTILHFIMFEKFNNSEKIILSILWIYFSFFIFHSNARIVIFSHLLITVYLCYLFTKKIKKQNLGILIVTTIVLSGVLFIAANDYSRERFFSAIQPFSKKSSRWNNDTSSPERIIIWRSALDAIKENFFFGSGIGDMHTELNKSYIKNGFKLGEYYNYNSHNQFLDFFLSMGVFGGVVFLFIFFLSFYYARNSYLYLSFLLLMFLCCTTENVLNTQRGIVFFSLFNSLLIFHAKHNDNHN